MKPTDVYVFYSQTYLKSLNLQNIFDIWFMVFAIWYMKLGEKFATNEKDCKYLEEIFDLQRYFNTKNICINIFHTRNSTSKDGFNLYDD